MALRVQVNLSDEMVDMVDKYSKLMGVSRSAFCAMLIGQGCMAYDKAQNALDSATGTLVDRLAQATTDLNKNK